jgi:hypothetical protein
MTMKFQVVKELLSTERLESEWREVLSEIDDESVKTESIERTFVLRDEYLNEVEAVTEEEDFNYVTAIKYIELKSKWIMLNTEINYRLYSRGEIRISLACKSSLLSCLLASIEQFVDQRDIDAITDFLSNPIAPQISK